jgi:hypothetical protein
VSQWVRRWEVTITWDRSEDSPYDTTRLVAQARTPAELRAHIEAARANPNTTSCRWRSIRTLAGDIPACCRRGHPYSGGSATQPRRDWAQCRCGGHLLLICRRDGCGDVRIDPEPALDCAPHRSLDR